MRSTVLTTLLVFGSMRWTLPSFSHSTQTEPAPKATDRAPAATSMRLSTRFVTGLIRSRRGSEGQVTQSEFSPKATLLHAAGRRSSPATLFSSGSIRARVVLESTIIHTLSDVAASPIIVSAVPKLRVAVILLFLVSNRTSPCAPQSGIHKEPKATIVPEHGCLRPATGSRGLLVFGSMRTTTPLDLSGTK